MTKKDALRAMFFDECEDLLEAMSDGFTEMEAGVCNPETINAVFRSVHSIKGGAAAFELQQLVKFAHSMENLLDDLRADRLVANPAIVSLLCRAGDQLFQLIEDARAGNESDSESYADLIKEIDAAGANKQIDAADNDNDSDDEAAESAFVPQTVSLDLAALAAPEETSQMAEYHIEFIPDQAFFSSGNDPIPLFRALREVGSLTATPDISALPILGEINCEAAYLSWTLILETEHSIAEIREVFEFVDQDAVINISRLSKPATENDDVEAPQQIPAAIPEKLELVSNSASLEKPEETLTEAGLLGEKRAANISATSKIQSIRVDLDRVDRLINLVGEMVISEAMLTQSLIECGTSVPSRVSAALEQLKRLSSDVQTRIMAIRAQSVKSLFQRMSRIAREASHSVGREVKLVIEGASTEVDKTVIEKLSDPLTHMIRNAVDHGLEPSEVRLAEGKPPVGTIRLSAAHRSGQVVIEISDDGAGIDAKKVFKHAVEKGLVSADAEMSEQEITNLLFEPGFSLAEKITNLSGRGVGMDVVRSEIQSLGGRVTISSELGAGTKVTIALPLTLAVVEGMLVRVEEETLIVPSTALRESMYADIKRVHTLGVRDPVLRQSGSLIPIIDLGNLLGYREKLDNIDEMPLLLVESATGRQVALTVDEVLDQREVVIKSLNDNYGRVPGIAAATILGDGRIALIIDIDQITETLGQAFHDMPPLAQMEG